MPSQEKISVYSLADLKHTSDDAIPNYLNSLKFKQSHRLTDVRLALGYGAVAIAAACFAWDFKFGFEDTKYLTAAAVAVYTVLNAVLTLWIWTVEKGIVYAGTAPSGEMITVATWTLKNVPMYNVDVTIKPKSGKDECVTLSRPFAEWFDAAGHFVAGPFQTMLATSVGPIGRLDAKRLAGASTSSAAHAAPPPAAGTDYTPEMLDAVMAASASGADAVAAGSASGVAKKSGGKRRKA